jgi:hypothetical protein
MTPIMVIRSWGGIVSRILSWQSSLLRPAQVRLLNRALRQSSARIALRAPIPMLKTLANSGFAGKRSGNVRHVQRRRLTTENGPANNFHLGRATNMLRIYFLLAMLCLSATFSVPAAQAWTQIGTLSCRVDPNIGFIIVGHQPMQCVYTQAPGTLPQVPPQSYDGALNTVGLSIGFSAGSVLGWAVFAPTTGVPAGALAGEWAFQRMSALAWCRRECPAWRLEPHHRTAAAFASGIRCRERHRWRVVAQIVLALVIEGPRDQRGSRGPINSDSA